MKKIILRNKINRFYSLLATIDDTYNNCMVTLEDLTNISIMEEVLYDLEENFYTFEDSRKLYHQVMKHIDKTERHRKLCFNSAVILATLGGLLTYGVAGSSDLDRLSMSQIIMWTVVGMIVIGISRIIYIKGEN